MSEALLPSADEAYSSPDAQGFFGPYGGTFVPETVMPVLSELDAAYREALTDPAFAEELRVLLADYVGRPSPLYRADRLAEATGLGAVYLKREDLNHTGAHKINNTLGQCLLAKRMGKGRVIAETGAGQHGVATATTAALMGLECAVFMGTEDIRRQSLNVYKMRLLGAQVVPVAEGSGTLADAVTAALRHWVERVEDTFYVIGSVVGPHPYPAMVRDFQAIIGEETIAQIATKAIPRVDAIVACVGGGSNAAGMFYPFLRVVPAEKRPLLVGAEAAGLGLDTDKHGAALTKGSPGVLHGFYSYLLQDESGNPLEAYSISAGLDYPGVGPEHSFLKDEGLVRYEAVTDQEAVDAFALLTRTEGIIPAIESSHALALLPRLAAELGPDAVVIVNVSGRGDKDMDIVREAGLGVD
ncbi:MAG: tryptophan synthase subunit beta [Actinomycetota bacterium]|nr:MAG: tryptophan synthase beta [Actinomycetota bacterium]MDP3630301.1 tryptophan synthase subunit beta [Actinomycetota bacterium]